MTGNEDNRVFVTVACLALFAISYALTPILDKYTRLQTVFPSDDTPQTGSSRLVLAAKQIVFGGFILAASWFIGGYFFQLLAGGYLLSLLIGIVLGLSNIFYLQGISRPGAATGTVRFSPEFAYRNLAMRLLTFGILMLGLFVIFGKLQFVGACIFTFSTAVGYLRRSAQARTIG